jgi:hypothetical protein
MTSSARQPESEKTVNAPRSGSTGSVPGDGAAGRGVDRDAVTHQPTPASVAEQSDVEARAEAKATLVFRRQAGAGSSFG